MAIVDVQNLIEAGVHFGHRISRWNPKMKPYILGKRNLIHIIDLRHTVRGLVRASNFLFRLVSDGGSVLVVGTKRQARSLVKDLSLKTGQHFVSERWLGGMLTNHKTIRERLRRLQEIETIEIDGTLDRLSKKEISSLRREKRKILRNLDGVRNMHELPSALIVIDPTRETIAVSEATKLGIPTICLIDTDANPEQVDICIPCNDDAFRSIQIILNVLFDAVERGRSKHMAKVEARRKEEEKKAEEERKERERKKAEAAQRAKVAAEAKAKALAGKSDEGKEKGAEETAPAATEVTEKAKE